MLKQTDLIREHITDIRQLAEEMALTAEGVPGMNLTLSKARIAAICRAFLAAPEGQAILLLRAWVAGCGDERFSTKEQCRDLMMRSSQFLARYPMNNDDDA